MLLRKNNPYYLAKIGELVKLQELLDKKQKLVNKRNKRGETALHIAAENNNKPIAVLLLSKGAEIDAQTEYFWTPLYSAVSASKETMSKFLIMKGANVKSSCKNSGRSILAVAIERGLIEITRILISKGAEVNSKDNLGATPLHAAAWHGQLEIAKLLLSMGADINSKDDQLKGRNIEGLEVGFTPLGYALDQNHQEVIKYLEEHIGTAPEEHIERAPYSPKSCPHCGFQNPDHAFRSWNCDFPL